MVNKVPRNDKEWKDLAECIVTSKLTDTYKDGVMGTDFPTFVGHLVGEIINPVIQRRTAAERIAWESQVQTARQTLMKWGEQANCFKEKNTPQLPLIPSKFEQCKCKEYTATPAVTDTTMNVALQKVFKQFGKEKVLPVVDWDEFKRGFKEELEHGCRNPATNLTCDDPVATAKIVLAHLNEYPNYYTVHNLGEK